MVFGVWMVFGVLVVDMKMKPDAWRLGRIRFLNVFCERVVGQGVAGEPCGRGGQRRLVPCGGGTDAKVDTHSVFIGFHHNWSTAGTINTCGEG
jgi:hypothetical protein